MARLRALNIPVVTDGYELVPGTAEHERYLQKLAEYLSDDDLAAMEASNSSTKTRNGVPLLPVKLPDAAFTLDLVNSLRDEDP